MRACVCVCVCVRVCVCDFFCIVMYSYDPASREHLFYMSICYIYIFLNSAIWEQGAYVTRLPCICDVTHILLCDMTWPMCFYVTWRDACSSMWHDCLIYVTWRMLWHTQINTSLLQVSFHVYIGLFWHMLPHTRLDSVTWRMCVCDMTHAHTWRNPRVVVRTGCIYLRTQTHSLLR